MLTSGLDKKKTNIRGIFTSTFIWWDINSPVRSYFLRWNDRRSRVRVLYYIILYKSAVVFRDAETEVIDSFQTLKWWFESFFRFDVCYSFDRCDDFSFWCMCVCVCVDDLFGPLWKCMNDRIPNRYGRNVSWNVRLDISRWFTDADDRWKRMPVLKLSFLKNARLSWSFVWDFFSNYETWALEASDSISINLDVYSLLTVCYIFLPMLFVVHNTYYIFFWSRRSKADCEIYIYTWRVKTNIFWLYCEFTYFMIILQILRYRGILSMIFGLKILIFHDKSDMRIISVFVNSYLHISSNIWFVAIDHCQTNVNTRIKYH